MRSLWPGAMMRGTFSMNKGTRLLKWLTGGPPFLFLLVFFVAPSLIMILASFRFPGEYGGLAPLFSNGRAALTLETYQFFFSDFIYTQVFIKSFGMALATTLICLLMAYPVALLIARSDKKFRDLMVLLVVLPNPLESTTTTVGSGTTTTTRSTTTTLPTTTTTQSTTTTRSTTTTVRR